MLVFSWNEWNVTHISKHGVTPAEAEHVVQTASRPFPRKAAGGRWLVHGQTDAGRWLRVVYVKPADEDVDLESLALADLIAFSDGDAEVVYVIHAMDLP
jgi:uncharacterized DUF497 family protein